MLEASEADVVLVAHHGFDGFARVKDIWAGGMVGTRVRVRMTRVPFAEIPEGRGHRTEWLFKMWQEMDDWISSLGAEGLGAEGLRTEVRGSRPEA